MYTDSVESVIHSCTFTENTAGGYGGVMYASSKSIVKMYNTVATDNAAGNGGFLYETTTGTTVTMAGLTVSRNPATVGGPIIWGNSTGAVLNIDKEKLLSLLYKKKPIKEEEKSNEVQDSNQKETPEEIKKEEN